MKELFFVFNSTDPDALAATGIGAYCNGKPWQATQVNNVYVGLLLYGDHSDRKDIDNLHPDLLTMPGPHGKVGAKHAAHLNKKGFPKVKEGDAFSDTLAEIYAVTGIEHYNPDNY